MITEVLFFFSGNSAERFGLSCKGLMSPQKNKINEIPLPAIFHINEHAEHYVVVYKISKKFVFISAPAFGLRKIKVSDFFNWWSGVFFIFFPTSDFEKGNEEKGLLFRFFLKCAFANLNHSQSCCGIYILRLLFLNCSHLT